MRSHIFALIVLAVGLAYLLNFAIEEPVEITSTVVSSEQDYDFYMTDVDSTHFGLEGFTEYRIQALRSTHYPNPEYNILDTPNFIIYQEGQAPWFVSAESGRIEKDADLSQDKVELSDNVIINHTNAQGEVINIYTDFLRIYPGTSTVSTDREVLIETNDTTITGVGMTANLDLNQIKLLANTRGRYYE